MDLLQVTADQIRDLASKYGITIRHGEFITVEKKWIMVDLRLCCPLGVLLVDKVGFTRAYYIVNYQDEDSIIEENTSVKIAKIIFGDDSENVVDEVRAFWNGFDLNRPYDSYSEHEKAVYQHGRNLRYELLGDY